MIEMGWFFLVNLKYLNQRSYWLVFNMTVCSLRQNMAFFGKNRYKFN